MEVPEDRGSAVGGDVDVDVDIDNDDTAGGGSVADDDNGGSGDATLIGTRGDISPTTS